MRRARLGLIVVLLLVGGFLSLPVSAQGRFWVLVNGALRYTGTVIINGPLTINIGPVTLPDGTAAAPSLAFTSSTAQTGLFKGAGNNGFCWSASNSAALCQGAGGASQLSQGSGYVFGWTAGASADAVLDTGLSRSAAATVVIGNGTAASFAGTLKTTTLQLAGKPSLLNNVTTAGMGTPIIVAQARTVAATNVGTASVATFTPAADGTFEVSCNVLVTTSTTHSFSCDTTYTDESNVARTMVMPVEQLAGTFATSGLITNATGVGPYESAVMTIRAKASTAITIRTSAGGTFTTVVYNIDGTIKQVG